MHYYEKDAKNTQSERVTIDSILWSRTQEECKRCFPFLNVESIMSQWVTVGNEIFPGHARILEIEQLYLCLPEDRAAGPP
jgi:DNA phosphorothioation-dependent restriction protein DptG